MKKNRWYKSFVWLLCLVMVSGSITPGAYAEEFPAVYESVEEEEMLPLTSEEMVPLTSEEMVPLTSEEMVPLSSEEMVPLTSEEMVPLASEENSDPIPGTPVLAGEGTVDSPYQISTAAELPQYIPENGYYILTADLVLEAGQQIETVEGVLDGRGHVITLQDRPLVDSNLGRIQNLGLISAATLTLTDYQGPLVINQNGEIENCYARTDTAYSGYREIGGLVGTVYGGTIRHCYAAGSCTSRYLGGIAAKCVTPETGTNITDCAYSLVTNYGPVSTIKDFAVTNTKYYTDAEMGNGTVTALLNAGDSDTGYQWITQDGYPILQEASSESVIRQELAGLVTEVEAYDASRYQAECWSVLTEALTEAQRLLRSETATDDELSQAQRVLIQAIEDLLPILPTEPVAPPVEDTEIHWIHTASDLAKISSSDRDSYYRLAEDIVIDSTYTFPEKELNCVLDGDGHSVIYDKASRLPFLGVGAFGVVQNISFTGSIKTSEYSKKGPLGGTVKGAILNCSSMMSGAYTSGFAHILEGGVLSNCFAYGDGVSAFFEGRKLSEEELQTGFRNTGTVRNSYWLNICTASDLSGADVDEATGEMNEDQMKSLEFAERMNSNKGIYGVSWGQSYAGYPYFGENQAYDPDGLPLPDNRYEVSFTYSISGEKIQIENHKLYVSPDDIDGYRSVGELSLAGVPEDSTITWSVSEDTPDSRIMTGTDTGGLVTVFGEGRALLTAVEHRADGTNEEAAYVRVFSKRRTIEELQLYLGDTNVTNAAATVAGSEWFTLIPMVRYAGETTFEQALGSSFNYIPEDGVMADHLSENSGEFRFTQAGTTRITVSSRYTTDVQASVEVTSTYVPVESIRFNLDSNVVIHGRNANSDGGKAFLPILSSLTILPENASNRSKAVINSSNPAVADYISSMVIGYVPYKAGTTTLSASIEDTSPDGTTKLVKTEQQVTYTYSNPVTELAMRANALEVEQGETSDLPITILGERSSEGLSVTEPGMTWEYSQPGIVSISQKNGAWKRNSEAADNNMYLPSAEYSMKGITPGVVTVTGTPVDPAYKGEPIRFQVTVTGEAAGKEELLASIDRGIEVGAANVQKSLESTGAVHGQEWKVYLLWRLGMLSDRQKQDYITSAAAKVKTWEKTQKPTDIERTALILAAMDEDITNIDGVNMAEMIYDHPSLTTGSNELIYALLALDAVGTPIPEDADRNRRILVDTLISEFQCSNGGFTLFRNGRPDVDLTAMALQALVRYTDSMSSASKAVEDGIVYLRSKLTANGGYDSCETDAQVILALALLGIDVTDPANGFGSVSANLITDMMEYMVSDSSGFAHTKGGSVNSVATVQAAEALAAYRRYMNEQPGYWNVNGSDEQIKVEDPDAVITDEGELVTIYASSEKDAAEEIRENFLTKKGKKNYENDRFTYTYQVYISRSTAECTDKSEGAAKMVGYIRQHTGRPNEGDYFKENVACSGEGTLNISGRYGYTMRIGWYYTTGEQEAELTKAIEDFQAKVIRTEMTDFEKVWAIYNYICSNIRYAYTTEEQVVDYLIYTAYGGMIRKTCVCAGYASLFYRLCLTNGIDCRIIGGAGHARNIVQLDGRYYICDTTWDEGKAPQDYQNCLVGKYRASDMAENPDRFFMEIYDTYDISEEDYSYTIPPADDPEAPSDEENQQKADAVAALIDAIGKLTADKKAAVEKASAAYEALNDAQKDLVPAEKKVILDTAKKAMVDLGKTTVSFAKTRYTYTGKKLTPAAIVKYGTKTLVQGTDYTVSYTSNRKVGTAKATITLRGKYAGVITRTFRILRANQKITVKVTSKTHKQSQLMKKAYSFKIGAKAKGGAKITYKSDSKKVKVSKTGKVTVAKKTPKGTYKVTVRTAATRNYKAGKRVIRITVK